MGFDLGGAIGGAAGGFASGGGIGAAIGGLAGGFGGGSSDGYKAPMKLARKQTKANIDMFNAENDRLGGYYDPYIGSGTYANEQIDNMLGRNGQAAADTAWSNTMSPGARFLEQQQNAALLRNKAALGDVGGNRLAALGNQSNLFNFGQAQTYMNNMRGQQNAGMTAANNLNQFRGANTSNIAQARNNLVNIKAGASIMQANQQNANTQNLIQGAGALGGAISDWWGRSTNPGNTIGLPVISGGATLGGSVPQS